MDFSSIFQHHPGCTVKDGGKISVSNHLSGTAPLSGAYADWPWALSVAVSADVNIFFFSLNVYLFIFERKGERQSGGERESQAGSMPAAQSPTWGLIPQSVRWRPEPKSRVGCLTY